MSITILNDSEKPREKAQIEGIENLADHELIAIILNTGTKKQNVIELAVNLLLEFNGLQGLMTSTLNDLCKVNGIKKAKAIKLMAVFEITKRIGIKSAYKMQVLSGESIFKIFGPKLRYEEQENFIVVFLDTRNQIIGYKNIAKEVWIIRFYIHDVFREAVKNNASKIIFVHNHPDWQCHTFIIRYLHYTRIHGPWRKNGYPLVDHIIIGDGSYYSFKSGQIK